MDGVHLFPSEKYTLCPQCHLVGSSLSYPFKKQKHTTASKMVKGSGLLYFLMLGQARDLNMSVNLDVTVCIFSCAVVRRPPSAVQRSVGSSCLSEG